MLNYKVPAADENKRLDIALAKLLKTSRSYVKFLIDNKHVLVNKSSEKPSYRVQVKDKLSVSIPEKKKYLDTNIHVPIISKDVNYIIYDKPWGMSVHPNDSKKPRQEVMLTDIIYRDFPKTTDAVERAGIVHRLDKNTSGLIIVALNNKFSAYIKDQFKRRKIKKTYKAIVLGALKPQKGIINAPITRSSALEGRMTVSGENDGREAQTNYEVDAYFSDTKNSYSLISAYPKTGRTHQIRVHMSSIGHPVVGDKLYGYTKKNANRQLLHAERLAFLDINNKEIEFSSPIPDDFKKFINSLRRIS